MGMSVVVQLALGWLLTQEDFGIYAIAIAFSELVSVFREGGLTRWLSRLSPREFEKHGPSALRLSFLLSLLAGIAMVLLAGVAGWLYGNRTITVFMMVIAAAFPFSAYTTVARAKLQSDLRFSTLARVIVICDFVRYALVVGLAWQGFGALSFAIPVVAVSVLEFGLLCLVTRFPIRRGGRALRSSFDVFRENQWSLYGSLASSVMRNWDYAVLGLLVPTEIVGTYFFAFQLTLKPVLLFSESMRRVVLPVFARLEDSFERQVRALRYVGMFLGFVAGPTILFVGVCAPSLTVILWRDRWLDAVVPIQILSLAMCFHLTALFAEMVAQSWGRFRLWTNVQLARGLGLTVVAAATPWLGGRDDVRIVAAVLGGYLALSGVLAFRTLFRYLELPGKCLWGGLARPLVISFVVAGFVILANDRLSFTVPTFELTFSLLAFAALLAVLFGLFARDGLLETVQMISRALGSGEKSGR